MKTLSCNNISDRQLLQFINNNKLGCGAVVFKEFENSVFNAMPNWVSERLALKKMRHLIRRELVNGCVCGCRGDFTITEKGKEFLLSGEK